MVGGGRAGEGQIEWTFSRPLPSTLMVLPILVVVIGAWAWFVSASVLYYLPSPARWPVVGLVVVAAVVPVYRWATVRVSIQRSGTIVVRNTWRTVRIVPDDIVSAEWRASDWSLVSSPPCLRLTEAGRSRATAVSATRASDARIARKGDPFGPLRAAISVPTMDEESSSQPL